MQLSHFKEFLEKVISEGNRLQKHDINGNCLSNKWLSHTQILSAIVAVIGIFLLPKGFSDNFAGYTVSFLGIFIGLFTTIVISMYDKSRTLFDNFDEKDDLTKSRIKQLRNYLVQFTGLTSYSILLALIVIILLLVTLCSQAVSQNIYEYTLITNYKNLQIKSVFYSLQVFILIIYRFSIVYMLLNFFFITIFSITSYFTFLMSEYKKLIKEI